MDIVSITIAVILLLTCIFIIFPSVIISSRYMAKEKEKRNKKKILTQILLQKEIEDEVEKEIKIEWENKVI